MHVESIQMDPRIARIHYSDYLKKVREARVLRAEKANEEARELESKARKIRISLSQQEKEDLELLSAYRTLSAGQRIINMHKVLWGPGLDSQGRPLLAIAPAHWRTVFFKLEDRVGRFQNESWMGKLSKSNHIDIPYQPHGPAKYLDRQLRTGLALGTISATVPSIPAHLRPAGDLSDYHILWEAEWRKAAPQDPLLLKKIKDSDKFFVILAQWDLTPLEQQVVEGRFA